MLTFAAGASSTVVFSVDFPDNMDDASPMYVDIIGKSGTTDDVTLSVLSFWGNGTGNNATYVTDTTSVTTTTATSYAVTIAAADVVAVQTSTFMLKVGAHTTDAVKIYGIRVRYSISL